MTRIAIIAGVLSLGAVPCVAAEWSTDFNIRGQLEHHDNPRLFPDGGVALDGLSSEVEAAFARRLETSELVLTPHLRFVRYDGHADFNTNDQSLDLHYTLTRERFSWQLGAGLVRDTTLTSELEDTGLIDARKRHESAQASGALTFLASPLDQFDAQLSLARSKYLDAAFTGLVDYDYAAAVVDYSRTVSQRTAVGLMLGAGRLQVPVSGVTNRNESIRLTLASALSDRFDLKLNVGADRTEAGERSDSGAVYSLSLTRHSELQDLALSAERSVAPSGSGVLVHRTEFGLTVRRRLSMRLGASFDLRQVTNQDLRFGSLSEDRVYRRAALSVAWQLTPRWSAFTSVAAAFDRQNVAGAAAEDAHALDAMLGVAWSMPRKSVSR